MMENIDKDDLIIVNPPICEEKAKHMDWIDMHMFVYGAKGSGKQLYAEVLHQQSSIVNSTNNTPFICGIVDSDPDRAKRDIFGYLEDEIFHPGFIEQAEHGTLYLHDISQLTEETSKELIKSIHEKSYFPVNSKETKKNNARFILSTDLISQNISKLSLDSSFNKTNMRFFSMPWAELPDDLPLEWHEPDDFDLVIKLIIKKVCKENNIEPIDISTMTFDILMNYHWPGNFHEMVCEIENAVKKKIAKNSPLDSPLLEPDCLNNELLSASTSEYAEFYLNSNDVGCLEEVEEHEQNIALQKEEPQEKIIYFYQKDDVWIIGEKEDTAIINGLSGIKFIHFLLQYPEKEINVLDVFELKIKETEFYKGENFGYLSIISKEIENNSREKRRKEISILTKYIEELTELLPEKETINEKEDLLEKIEQVKKELKIYTDYESTQNKKKKQYDNNNTFAIFV